MTHTSTSPNHQILASLDVGRAQAELEGYQLVQRQAELAMNLMERRRQPPANRQVLQVPRHPRDDPLPLPPIGDRLPAARRLLPDGEGQDAKSRDGNLQDAYFLAYVAAACEYLSADQLAARVAEGREVVSAMFVTPYPPGFPILVPGQVVTSDILDFMSVLDTREIHGYLPEFGYRVFTEEVLRGTGHD
jgi:arginine/lysine/ornithine decarboxylase